MARKGHRRYIDFESLESLALMSVAAGTHQEHLLALIAREQAGGPVQLVGTVKGTYHSKRGAGAPMEINAKGPLNSIGRLTVKGTITLSSTKPAGSSTLSGKQGKLHTAAIGDWSLSATNNGRGGLYYQPPGTPGGGDTGVPGQPPNAPVTGDDDVTFKITGGTGEFASESGNADAVITVVVAKGKGVTHGNITIEFVNLTA
jgi:hypothetical protein